MSLKKIFILGCASFCFCTWGALPLRAEFTETRENERQFLLLRQEDQILGSGIHRPFTTISVRAENNFAVWDGKTDFRGAFSFALPATKLAPERAHTLTVTAVDQFGRSVQKSDGSPDILKAILLPGLSSSGRSDVGAQITLLDPNGKILQTNTTDATGNYAIMNAPEGSTVRIVKNNKVQEIPFVAGTLPPVFLEKELLKNAAPEVLLVPSLTPVPTNSSHLFLWTFGGVLLCGAVGLGIFFFWKHRNATFE